MKKYKLNELTEKEVDELINRTSINFEATFQIVKPILEDIKVNGLSAALKYSNEFGENFGQSFKVTEDEFLEAEKNILPELKAAINQAAKNIKLFHKKQLPKIYEVETTPGIICSREFRAIENVGLYIPGGNAVLFSTVLMLGIPAQIAGCGRVVVCSPTKSGKLEPALLYSAKLCGVKEFYKIGGAQAIGLMAYGDSHFQKVYKIFGPGNQFVTAAKLLVGIDPEGCAVDMPAGPSEVLVISDENANAKFVAADLLSQAEHGNDSQSILVSTSSKLINNVEIEIEKQLSKLGRKNFAEETLINSYSVLVRTIDEAINFSNKYAPEHLIMNFKNAEDYKDKVTNAGSVFIGEYSPESAGDYASGTNHTLPTSGYSKMHSGLSVESFMKSITFQKLSKKGLHNISDTVIKMAEAEKLDAHANAVKVRLENGN